MTTANPSQPPSAPSSVALRGPLSGLLILEVAAGEAAPITTLMLAELGARVVKLESAKGGDEARPRAGDTGDGGARFAALNRGKESLAVDLTKDADRLIVDKLLERADAVVEGLGPGVLDKLGYGWEQLHGRFPRLVYAATSSFGHTGPYASREADGDIVESISGLVGAGAAGGRPLLSGVAIADTAAALYTALGVAAALYHRTLTGEAVKVDVASLDALVAVLNGPIAEPDPRTAGRAPSWPCLRAKDGHLVISARGDAVFKRAAEALGLPWVASDPRFATAEARSQNGAALVRELEAALAADTVANWIVALTEAHVPAGPVNTPARAIADPQVRSRNMVVGIAGAEGDAPAMAGNPIKMSSFPDPATRNPAPALDADRARILAEVMAPAPGSTSHRALASVPSVRRSAGRLLDYLRQAMGVEVSPRDMLAGSFRERARSLADALISERGEVLGTVLAAELVHLVKGASGAERFELYELLATAYGQEPRKVQVAAERWRNDQSPESYARLMAAVEPPRQELFRRMNMAPGGTAVLVKLREDLIRQLRDNPRLAPVDHDLRHLLGSWFNRGFLKLERISWHTPAVVLEKLIEYEAVHEIDGWDDLQRRLAADRRCYGFFHPALPDEPLIFVEVALGDRIADRIEPIIRAPAPAGDDDGPEPTAAIFYSISNCQPGLKGISFGNFLIKQVAAELKREFPDIETFATLSPIPGFRAWLESPSTDLARHLPKSVVERILKETGEGDLRAALLHLARIGEAEGYSRSDLLRQALLHLGARYLAGIDSRTGPPDSVARFHLGNGARIEQLDWMGDLSPKGIRQSHGLMVNYLYDLDEVERNHEAFANGRPVAVSKTVAELIDIAETELLPQALKSLVRKSSAQA